MAQDMERFRATYLCEVFVWSYSMQTHIRIESWKSARPAPVE